MQGGASGAHVYNGPEPIPKKHRLGQHQHYISGLSLSFVRHGGVFSLLRETFILFATLSHHANTDAARIRHSTPSMIHGPLSLFSHSVCNLSDIWGRKVTRPRKRPNGYMRKTIAKEEYAMRRDGRHCLAFDALICHLSETRASSC